MKRDVNLTEEDLRLKMLQDGDKDSRGQGAGPWEREDGQ